MSVERIVQQLEEQQESDRKCKHLEPSIDERDLKIDDGGQQREEEDLERGAVLKRPIHPGEGQKPPKIGEMVFLHYTIMDKSGNICLSTRKECGGPGQPQPFVLGKGGYRPLRGIELALVTMSVRERCVLELKPEYAYLHPQCTFQPPEGLRKDENIRVDLELTGLHPGDGAHAVGSDGVMKKIYNEGEGWETPRAPFKVFIEIRARVLPTYEDVLEVFVPTSGKKSSPNQEKGDGKWVKATDRVFDGTSDVRISEICVTEFNNYFEDPELSCSLGTGALPPGLDAAVCSMRREEHAVVVCPLALATGGTLVPPPSEQIPDGGFDSLKFVEYTVTLLDFLQVRDLAGDGSATKCTLRKGRGEFPADCPMEDTTVQARIRVRSVMNDPEDGVELKSDWQPLRQSDGGPSNDDDPKDREIYEIQTGMGEVPAPVDSALRLMLRGEVSLVTSTYVYGYGDRDDCPFMRRVNPDSWLEFEVELVDFEPETNMTMMGPDDKLDRAEKWRRQGNVLFKTARYALARLKYQKALKAINQTLDMETEEQFSRAKAGKISCLLNLGLCAQRQDKFGEAISWCNKTIEEDEENAKAYFRRGVANTSLGEYAQAMMDFELSRHLDPSCSSLVDKELGKMGEQVKKDNIYMSEMSGFLSKEFGCDVSVTKLK